MFARRTLSTLLVLAAVARLAGSAAAGTATDNLGVTATVSNSCTITGGTLAFGTYDTISGAEVSGSGSISVACTKGASATITLGQGQNADTGSTDASPLRRMSDGGSNFLKYSLFTDSGHTTVWGNTAGTGKSYTATSSTAAAQTVFGSISSSQDVPAGSYSDSVVATVTF